MKNPAAHKPGSQPRVQTVSQVCERHVADQPNACTASTYRSRLRPLLARYGELAASDALAALGEAERELTAQCGAGPAHKAVTLLKAALRDAGYELFTLVEASRHHHVAVPSLRELVKSERVRCRDRRPHGRAESILFDSEELADDLAELPSCLAEGCQAAGTGPSGYCGEHFDQGGRRGAARVEAELLTGKRDWYTVGEAARRLRESGMTTSTRIERGELPSERVGRHRRIPRDAVKQLRKQLAKKPRRKPRPTAVQTAARRDQLRGLWPQPKYKDKPGALAAKLGVSKSTVYRDLEALSIERPGKGRQLRRLTAEKRKRREQQAVELYGSGYSLAEVSGQIGSCATQVRRDLEAAGAEIRPKRRQPKYTAPAERLCEWCREPFTPEFPAFDIRDGQPKPRRFCGDPCARDWRAAQPEIALQKRGLLSIKTAGEKSGVGESFVVTLINRGLLHTERIEYTAMLRPAHGITPAELKRALREWGLNGDGRRAAGLNADYAIARAERSGTIEHMVAKLGITSQEAHDVIRGRVQRRRQALARHSKGPRSAPGPRSRDLRWVGQFLELRAEVAYHQQQLDLKLVDEHDGERYQEALEGAKRSDYSLAMEIAECDWRERPGENFRRDEYPPQADSPERMRADMRRQAGQKVLKATQKATKALQSARTEKTAA